MNYADVIIYWLNRGMKQLKKKNLRGFENLSSPCFLMQTCEVLKTS